MVFGYFLLILIFHDPICDPVCDPVHDPVQILSTADKFIHVVKLDACKCINSPRHNDAGAKRR